MNRDGWRIGFISPGIMNKNEQYHKEQQWSEERSKFPKNEKGCEMLLDGKCFIYENRPQMCKDYFC